jgi:hypothetical protein
MTLGISAAHSNSIINVMRSTSYTSFTPWLKLHTGDPGSAGTANASAETTRKQLTFADPAGTGSAAATAVTWTSWGVGSETITHVSLWDASSAGNFKMSAALASSLPATNGATVSITATTTAGTLAA